MEETEKHTQSFSYMGSGLHSVNVALKNNHPIIILIGHDFWGTGSKA